MSIVDTEAEEQRTPCPGKASGSYKTPKKEAINSDGNHGPIRLATIWHVVQSEGHVRMAVVTKYIVHACLVL